MKMLENYFDTKNPISLRRIEFSRMTQEKGQSLSNFATKLRGLWIQCDFADLDPEEWLLTVLAHGCRSKHYKDKLRELKGRPWRYIKESIQQWEADQNEDKGANVDQVRQVQKSDNRKRDQPRKKSAEGKCYRCGSTQHKAGDCKLSRDIDCNNCGKKGHLARVCMGKKQEEKKKGKARQVKEEDHAGTDTESSEDTCEAVGASRDVLFS